MVEFLIFLGFIILIALIIGMKNSIEKINNEQKRTSSKIDDLYTILKQSDNNTITKNDLINFISGYVVSENKEQVQQETKISQESLGENIVNHPHEYNSTIEKTTDQTLDSSKTIEPSTSIITSREEDTLRETAIKQVSEEVRYANIETKKIATKYEATEALEPQKPSIETKTIRTKGQTVHANKKSSVNKQNLLGRLFNENLLPKIGIITFVLGVAFFIKYAIDKDWINEIGRVGIGIATGALLAGIAHYLRQKYHTFSSLLMGGGIAIFYLSITLAFQEYELMSQTTAFVLLIVITIFAVLFSLLYDRQELAVIALVGGFASPLMVSTGEGNYIVLFTYLFILNTGLLIISLRKRWNIVCILSFVFTLAFYWIWLTSKFSDQIGGAMLFGLLFYIQFYALSIIRSLSKDKQIGWLETVIMLVNNLAVVLSSLYILDNQTNIKGLVIIALAIVNAAIMIVLYKKSNIDKNIIYALLAVVISLVSLAIPIQLDGYVITMFWAIEIAVLTWMWCKTKIRIFNWGTYVLILLTIVSYIIDVIMNYFYVTQNLPILINKIFLAGVVVIVALYTSIYLLRKYKLKESEKIKYKSFFILFFIFTFLVPFLELGYQLGAHFIYPNSYGFDAFILSIYFLVYVSCIVVVFRKKLQTTNYTIAFTLLALLCILYSYNVSNFQEHLFDCYPISFTMPSIDEQLYDQEQLVRSPEYSTTLINLHWIAFLAVAVTIGILISKIKNIKTSNFRTFAYLLTILSVFSISVTTDSVALSLLGDGSNYDSILSDCHTFVYPIIWGLIAFGVMLYGIRTKEVILRKISLLFFGLIIGKFYIYDVWMMSQFGRILSFVALGIILLLASFLLQRIKNLIKDGDKVKNEVNNKNNDQ